MDDDARELARIVEALKRAGEGSVKRSRRTRDQSPIRRRPCWVDPVRAVRASRRKFGPGARLCDESEPQEEERSEFKVAATVAEAGDAGVVKGGNEKGECSPIRAEGDGDVEVLHLQFGPHKVSIRTYRDKSQTEGKEKGGAVAPKVAAAGVEVVGTTCYF